MNKTIGYGTTHRTRTHIIANWTDGTRTYAHARPIQKTGPAPDERVVNALDELLHSLFEWDYMPKYPKRRWKEAK